MQWRHVILNAIGSWLHGDPRGFRDRFGRVHSSGDYRNPPPPGEHAGLLRYMRDRSHGRVRFDACVRSIIIARFVEKTREQQFRIICCALSRDHLHALMELPDERDEVRRVVGRSKQAASHAAREYLPGSIWSKGGEYRRIVDKQHLHNAYHYIRTRQERGTLVWSHRPDENWIDNELVELVWRE